MGRLQEAQPSVLHEGDAAAAELDLGKSLWWPVRKRTAWSRSGIPDS